MDTHACSYMNFSKRLKDARSRAGLTLDELSYGARIPYARLRSWEKDGKAPALSDDLIRLAVALDTSPSWLFFGDRTHDYPLLPKEAGAPA